MAAKLGLLSLTQLQQLAAQSQPDSASAQASWMWSHTNPSKDHEDDSWEVKAFAEDYTGTAAGSTWPPRSYSCSFCRREFRSAQALGGHMNVHRRDRASGRLQQTLVQSQTATTTAAAASAFIIPAQELSAINGGLCLLYKLPHPNYQPNAESSSSLMNARKAESPSSFTGDGHWGERNIAINYKVSGEEDLDLELRLGQKPIKS